MGVLYKLIRKTRRYNSYPTCKRVGRSGYKNLETDIGLSCPGHLRPLCNLLDLRRPLFYSSWVSCPLCATRNRRLYASHHFNLGICWSTLSARQRTNHGLGDISLPQGFPLTERGVGCCSGDSSSRSRSSPRQDRPPAQSKASSIPRYPSRFILSAYPSSAANASLFIPCLPLGTATRREENLDSAPRRLHWVTCALYPWGSIWRRNVVIGQCRARMVFKVLNRLFKGVVLYLTIPLIYSMKKMFTTNSYIHKMFHSRTSERSCQKCKVRITCGMNFHCTKCGEWYCLPCGIDLGKCPKCGSKLE